MTWVSSGISIYLERFLLMWAVMAVDDTSGDSDWPSTRYVARSFGQGAVSCVYFSSYHPVRNFMSIWALICLWNINYISDRVNREGFTSARLCPLERLPSGLHAHGAFAIIWAPIRSGPSLPHYYMCQWARLLPRVKLAVICGVRSALRRWSCSNCEHRCEHTYCVRKYNERFNLLCWGQNDL